MSKKTKPLHPKKPLPGDHHVVRYVPKGLLRRDADLNVIGVQPQAFQLRWEKKKEAVEEYLSAAWPEFYGTSMQEALQQIATCLQTKGMAGPDSGLAVGVVEQVKEVCANSKPAAKIRIVHEHKDWSPSYTAVRQVPVGNSDVFERLAAGAWSQVFAVKNL